MPAHKKYNSLEQKKAADAKRKRDKRAAEKLKKTAESNDEWILQILIKVCNEIRKKSVQKIARRQKDRERKSQSRLGLGVTNVCNVENQIELSFLSHVLSEAINLLKENKRKEKTINNESG